MILRYPNAPSRRTGPYRTAPERGRDSCSAKARAPARLRSQPDPERASRRAAPFAKSTMAGPPGSLHGATPMTAPTRAPSHIRPSGTRLGPAARRSVRSLSRTALSHALSRRDPGSGQRRRPRRILDRLNAVTDARRHRRAVEQRYGHDEYRPGEQRSAIDRHGLWPPRRSPAGMLRRREQRQRVRRRSAHLI